MWTLLALALADPTPPAVRERITDQLEAFERADRERAWKHVAPGLQQQFQSADRFFRMVEQGYAPLIAPRRVTFDDFTRYGGEPAQWLTIEGSDGSTYRALYLLEQQPDGTWRTAGCFLFKVEEGPTLT